MQIQHNTQQQTEFFNKNIPIHLTKIIIPSRKRLSCYRRPANRTIFEKAKAGKSMEALLFAARHRQPQAAPVAALKRFTFEKGETRGGGTAPPGPT